MQAEFINSGCPCHTISMAIANSSVQPKIKGGREYPKWTIIPEEGIVHIQIPHVQKHTGTYIVENIL